MCVCVHVCVCEREGGWWCCQLILRDTFQLEEYSLAFGCSCSLTVSHTHRCTQMSLKQCNNLACLNNVKPYFQTPVHIKSHQKNSVTRISTSHLPWNTNARAKSILLLMPVCRCLGVCVQVWKRVSVNKNVRIHVISEKVTSIHRHYCLNFQRCCVTSLSNNNLK